MRFPAKCQFEDHGSHYLYFYGLRKTYITQPQQYEKLGWQVTEVSKELSVLKLEHGQISHIRLAILHP